MGLKSAARQVVRSAAPDSLAANENPLTVAESLGKLDDGYRRMLLDAARGDRDAHSQAAATMPLWWDVMPEMTRHNIDFKVNAWHRDHPHVTDRAVAARKLDMLIAELRNQRRSGITRLGAAGRIPA